MEFGMFHEFQRLPGASEPSAFADSFAQIDAAEQLGLDAMWLAELHFAPERSVLASPMLLAAAIAERTKRMKIGTAVQVLPLCHPLRLAEEVATVDQLSNGRLIFGVGRSGFAHTYKTYGVDYGESRERFAETLHIVKRAFTEERFSHQGKYYAYENVRAGAQAGAGAVARDPHRRGQPRHLRRGGREGHRDLRRRPRRRSLRPGAQREGLSRGVEKAGHEGKGQVFLRVPVYVAETEEAALEEPRESIMHLLRYIGDRLAQSAGAQGTRAIENRAERGARMLSIDYDEVLRERMIVGTPARVIDRLTELQEKLGLDGILAELNPGSRIPHERVMTALRLLCEDVMPRFK